MPKSALITVSVVSALALGAALIGLIPVWALLPVVAGAFLVRGYNRASEVNKLVDAGVPATATIIKKLFGRRPTRNVYMWYAFETPEGTFEARTDGKEHEFAHLAVGDSIEIVYLPDQPNVSAPKWVVAQGRQARDELAARAARGSAKE